MKDKEIYLQALITNKGRLNAIELGEVIGMNEDEVQICIAQLLNEHKIEHVQEGACEYRIMRKNTKN